MRKILGILSFIMLFSSSIFAQHVKFKVSDIQAADPGTAQQIEAVFKTMKLDIYNNDAVTISNIDMMNGMSNTKVYYYSAKESTVTCMDIMGQKIKVVPTAEEIKSMKAESDAKKTEVKKIDGDTKQFAGYSCQRYIVTTDGTTYDMYVAPDLKIGTKTIQGLESVKLDGFPLEYTVDFGGNKVTITAESVEKDFDTSKIAEPTGKYKEMNFTDFKAQMGGMMGGQ